MRGVGDEEADQEEEEQEAAALVRAPAADLSRK